MSIEELLDELEDIEEFSIFFDRRWGQIRTGHGSEYIKAASLRAVVQKWRSDLNSAKTTSGQTCGSERQSLTGPDGNR